MSNQDEFTATHIAVLQGDDGSTLRVRVNVSPDEENPAVAAAALAWDYLKASGFVVREVGTENFTEVSVDEAIEWWA